MTLTSKLNELGAGNGAQLTPSVVRALVRVALAAEEYTTAYDAADDSAFSPAQSFRKMQSALSALSKEFGE
ncbi:MAG: hypothetical protein EB015_15365 [Methylocystaceae bacterium]|nr:hypothetical protein [Methylocystaceae bacterium]